MSLFKNRNKTFEEKLGNQFEGLEYKPSESLWDKISSNVPEDSFETVVSDRVNSYQPKPYPETWEQIKAQLPPERNRNNRKLYWISLLLLLLGTTIYLANELNKQQTKTVVKNEQTENRITKTEAQKGSLPNNIEQDKNIKTTVASALAENKSADKKSNAVNPSTINPEQATTQKIFATEQTKKVTKKEGVESRKSNQHSVIVSALDVNIVSNKPLKEKTYTNAKQSSEPIAFSNQTVATPPPLVTDGETKTTSDNNKPEQSKSTTVNHVSNTVSSEPQQQALPEKTNTSNPSTSTTTNGISEVKNNTPVANEITPISDSTITSFNNRTPKADSTTNKEFTRFSITILTGMHYCFNSLSAPSNTTINFSDNIALRRKLEKPELDWSGAFLLDYAITTKWRLSTGLMISNFSQSFQFATTSPSGNHDNLNEPNATVANPNDSIVSGTGYSNRIKYTWTEIPLFITYSFSQKGKLGFDLMGGVSYAFINGVDASYVSYNNIGVLQVKDNNSFPGVKNNFFVHLNPTVSYKINNLISLGMAPTFKYSLTSITGKDNWVQQHPYFIGLSLSLRKQF